eukprot:4127408-Pleurochrysis_carterae.AAC.2
MFARSNGHISHSADLLAAELLVVHITSQTHGSAYAFHLASAFCFHPRLPCKQNANASITKRMGTTAWVCEYLATVIFRLVAARAGTARARDT